MGVERPGVAALQGAFYERGHDYRSDSPHLRHHRVHDRLVALLERAMATAAPADRAIRVLDIGAGDGAFVEVLLARGAEVTATEVSRASVEALQARFGRNPALTVRLDPDGTLEALGEDRFDLILYASVLHHIPDYVAAIRDAVERHLNPGGAFVSIQDPLYYPRLPRGVRPASDAAYLLWRVVQGNVVAGVKARIRRSRGRYDDSEPADVVEYHVVRQGVDEQAIAALLADRFEAAEIVPYWSTWLAPMQALGERAGLANTFAAVAAGHRG